MRFKMKQILHITSSIIYFLCLSLNLVALFGASWIQFNESTDRFKDHQAYFGITRTCRSMSEKRYCKYRTDIFTFKYLTYKEEILMDVIFFQFIISTICLFVGMNCSLLRLLLFHRTEETISCRKCFSVLSIILSSIAGILNLSAMVYFQVKVPHLPPRMEEGWSCAVGWLSSVLVVLCIILSAILHIRDHLLHSEDPQRTESPSSTLNYPLERYFYGSSRQNSMSNFNQRWFDERYSTTALNGYLTTGVTGLDGITNEGYTVEVKSRP